MEQLILHLIGDYILQTHWMAVNKVKSWTVAIIHALVYSLPFLLLRPSLLGWFVIFSAHAVIDRFSLAKYLLYAKNKITSPDLPWTYCTKTGYQDQNEDKKHYCPMFITFWLYAAADNTLHLIINYASLRWL